MELWWKRKASPLTWKNYSNTPSYLKRHTIKRRSMVLWTVECSVSKFKHKHNVKTYSTFVFFYQHLDFGTTQTSEWTENISIVWRSWYIHVTSPNHFVVSSLDALKSNYRGSGDSTNCIQNNRRLSVWNATLLPSETRLIIIVFKSQIRWYFFATI